METTNIIPLIEDLSASIYTLEETLQPLLSSPLSSITSRLPLLDRAKLHVLLTYGIESIIFAYLKLSNVDANAHPVYTELNRVKQYFEKIKEAETAGPSGKRLDKGAAARFIKAGLAGNERFDAQRKAQVAAATENAVKKLAAIPTAGVEVKAAKEKGAAEQTPEVGTAQRFKHLSKKRKAEDIEAQPSSSAPNTSEPVHIRFESQPSTSAPSRAESPASGRKQVEAQASTPQSAEKPKGQKRKKRKSLPLSSEAGLVDDGEAVDITKEDAPFDLTQEEIPAMEAEEEVEEGSPTKKKKREETKEERRVRKEWKKENKGHKSHTAPKSGSTVFQALLNKPAKKGSAG